MSRSSKAFIAFIVATGMCAIALGMSQWGSLNLLRFLCYLAIALVASGMKVQLPGIYGTMSVNFLFILIGIVELSYPETMVIGCAAILVQCMWNTKRGPQLVHLVFNVCNTATAIAVAYYCFHTVFAGVLHNSLPLLLAAVACVYFVVNTMPIAVAIALTENKSSRTVWKDCYFWTFPYYLIGAAVAGLVSVSNHFLGWQTSLLVMPLVYGIFRVFRLYLERLEAEKKHVEEMSGLHLRTIESLALAIEAKDQTTHSHLCRVRVYAMEIAKELKLDDSQVEALRAAALLHDIGKLAVPEHIISKPGKLTPEEFEKMKIHPVVGAEILSQVKFPYPVVPIVRSHHEAWDGSGYPDGLRGKDIPIGARILSAVDCLDALASDRQYRRALPLDLAMDKVASMSGKNYDPEVVEILQRRYVELEHMARIQEQEHESTKLSTQVKVQRGLEPGVGFEINNTPPLAASSDFLSAIAGARQEAQMLFELSQTLGSSLSLDETLSVLGVRLHRMVGYDAMAVFVPKDEMLAPEYVSGENFRLFSSLRIPVGEGLCGWVAENCKPIVNGNPMVEPGYSEESGSCTMLRSALAVPLKGLNGVVGVLALYRTEKDAFTNENLRILLAISSKVAFSMENALRYQMAESSATTDYLTGLPNARSLFLHLDRELARSKRLKTPLTVLVCDLDGFKKVNDRFGHLEGDKVLRLLAQGFKALCREYDYVARMGGDEFVVVAPGMTPETLQAKILQLKRIAVAAGQEVCGESLLSLSVGQAFYPDGGTDAEELLANADRRMYVAKQEIWNARAASFEHSKTHPLAPSSNAIM